MMLLMPKYSVCTQYSKDLGHNDTLMHYYAVYNLYLHIQCWTSKY